MNKALAALCIGLLLISCNMKKQADLILVNGNVYTVDTEFSKCEAIAVKDGIILSTGTTDEIFNTFSAPQITDLDGAAVYPGFNDAHGHLIVLGQGLQNVDLRGASSFEEILSRLQQKYEEEKPPFLAGEGWDQNLWLIPELPDNALLNKLFPDIPVVLSRIDYHAVIANEKAIRMLGISPNDTDIPDGEAIVKNGKFTGVFLEGTSERFYEIFPTPGEEEMKKVILAAQDECFRYGLTSVSTAGENYPTIRMLQSLNNSGDLKLRLDVWMGLDPENMQTFTEPYQHDRIRIGTLKLYMDGALGSRGALLIEPYSDETQTKGIKVISDEDFYKHCEWAYKHGHQVATHAIGDAANHETLKAYIRLLSEGNDLRWRIEHAQIIQDSDMELFGKYNIIPSIQPTHATSDMLWADERLGERIKTAYRYKELLAQNGWIPAGTDFPIEEVNPVYTFFAAVYRKNLNYVPQEGFQMENALTKEEALRSMTIWAAKASFEEDVKGSIETGKYADFVVLDRDIMTVDERQIPDTKVLMTFVGGELVYKAP